jgi:hypothetical protein
MPQGEQKANILTDAVCEAFLTQFLNRHYTIATVGQQPVAKDVSPDQTRIRLLQDFASYDGDSIKTLQLSARKPDPSCMLTISLLFLYGRHNCESSGAKLAFLDNLWIYNRQ